MTDVTTKGDNPIVVGVDGSPSSNAALAWAVHQSKLTGARVLAVTTWEVPTNYGWAVPWPDGIDFEEDARVLLHKTVVEVLGDNATIELTESVVEGHAALVLVDLAKDAEVLVVGCRGHGAFSGMLLGSVSAHAVAHASCPVVVVHDHED